jgi:hypothetical protein
MAAESDVAPACTHLHGNLAAHHGLAAARAFKPGAPGVAFSQFAPSEIVSAHAMLYAHAVHHRARFFPYRGLK